MAPAYNPSTWELRQEDYKFKTILGYISRPYLKKQQPHEIYHRGIHTGKIEPVGCSELPVLRPLLGNSEQLWGPRWSRCKQMFEVKC
jgi:hypothetical protein